MNSAGRDKTSSVDAGPSGTARGSRESGSESEPSRAFLEETRASLYPAPAGAEPGGLDAATAQALAPLLSHAPDALLVVDASATVRFASEAAGRLWGEPPAALVGRPLAALLEGPGSGWADWGNDPVTPVEMRAVRAGAQPLPVEVGAGPLGLFGRPLRILSLRDASARLAREAALARLALTDALTGLANRLAFEDRLKQAIHRVDRFGGLVAVHFLDLDGFKRVNDDHGHRVGDAVLVALAGRLRPVIRATDTLARIGGDEFALLQPDLCALEGARLAAARILDVLAAPIEAAGLTLSIGASVGAAVYPLHGRRPEAVCEAADRALYAAKRTGGGVMVLAGEEATPAAGAREEEG